MGRTRYKIHDASEPHFLTCTIRHWLPVFRWPEAAEAVIESWRFLGEHAGLIIYGYVIMEDHLHAIAAAPDLPGVIARFKSFTALRILEALRKRGDRTLLWLLSRRLPQRKANRQHQVWQEGSHPKQIVSHEMMRQKLDYIHNNPVRRGYVDDPADWRYSSARNYQGLSGLLDVETNW